jgi:membrane associated rhomboid family serine protease
MAATARFAFSGGLGGFSALQSSHYGRCLTLVELRYNQQAMIFLGIWLVLNLVFGLTGGGTIAWEAHLGGFVAGLLVFPYHDPLTKPPRRPKPPKKEPPKKKPEHLRVIK